MVSEIQFRKRDVLHQKLKKTLDLRVSEEITKEQAEMMKKEYEKEISDIEQEMFKKENELSIALFDSHAFLNFAQNCIEKFKNGDQKVKKELVAFFCSNLILFEE